MRHTARGIIFNNQTNKILLIKYLDLETEVTKEFTEGYWVTPGGGLEENESYQEALKREIYEETGITDIEIGNCVINRVVNLELIGEKYFLERFYLVKTDCEEIDMIHVTELEKSVIVDYRWWSVEEIKSSDEVIFPRELKHVLELDLNKLTFPVDVTDEKKVLL